MGERMPWLILLKLSFAIVHGHDVGFDGWYQPVPHQPVDIITDVINDLGVRILQQYTAHGNVAFSPTGVSFILVALYEGSAGRGRQQIVDALGLPRDRDTVRIGFRDIHRRLRTYLNADGFLGGLTLNRENTKLRPEYEDVLRFYGFDLSVPEEETNATARPGPETTMTVVTETPITEAETTMRTVTAGSTRGPEATGETSTSTTPMVNLAGMTMNTPDLQSRMTQTTPPSSTVTDAAEAASTTASSIGTSSVRSTSTPFVITTAVFLNTDESTLELATAASTDRPPSIEENTSTTSAPASAISPLPAGSTAVRTSASTESPESAVSTGQTAESTETDATAADATEAVSAAATVSTTTPTVTETTSIFSTSSTANVTEGSSTIPAQVDETSTVSGDGSPVDRNTVSTVMDDGLMPGDNGSTDSEITIDDMGSGSTIQPKAETTTVNGETNRGKRSIKSPRGFFSSYPDEGIWMQDLGIWKPYSTSLYEASVRDSTEISFLVNGCDVHSVTASRYFAVLPFAYFPSLHAVALEFPLDDPRYNILLMMATDRRDTYKLARDLDGKSLRLLRKQLQATWVRATIPSFMLRGFVTLTSYLQRLGMVDVFDPRAADLSPMTPDLGVYARDVQQSIGVNIRNYMKPDRTHSRNGLFERAGPVPFTVVHPFLYFIVDVETSVVLIAGRVNDPLNSRIL